MKFNTSLIFGLQLKDNQYSKLLQICNEQFVSNLTLVVCCIYYTLDRNGFFLDELQYLYQEITDRTTGSIGASGGAIWRSAGNTADKWFCGLAGGHKALKRHV